MLLDCSLTHQNLRGATLSSKDIPISPYTKGKNNNNNNIVSSLVQYSSWIINLYFKVIQVLFLLNTYCLQTLFYTFNTSRNIPDNSNGSGGLIIEVFMVLVVFVDVAELVVLVVLGLIVGVVLLGR